MNVASQSLHPVSQSFDRVHGLACGEKIPFQRRISAARPSKPRKPTISVTVVNEIAPHFQVVIREDADINEDWYQGAVVE